MKRLLAAAAVAVGAHAAPAAADRGPLGEAVFGDSDTAFDLRGWGSGGMTFNAGSSSSYNGPVSFNDRSAEPQLNQFYLVAERSVKHDGDTWDLGGRADFLYGSDAQFTHATGWDDNIVSDDTSRFYKVAFPQAYVEGNVPVLEGVSVKAGHFYTPIGYEVVTAPDNFFYSHAYTMQYGEPFTHFGALASTPFCDGKFTVSAGAVRGWDNMSDTADGNYSGLGGFTWSPTDSTTVVFTAISGNEGEDANRSLYSTVVTHKVTDSLSYVFQHDNGVQEVSGGDDARWYGVNQYLIYQLNDEWAPGARFEWFADPDGARVAGLRSGSAGGPSDYYALSLGVNYKPYKLLTLRPEVRFDLQDRKEGGSDAFDKGRGGNQTTLAMDAIVKF